MKRHWIILYSAIVYSVITGNNGDEFLRTKEWRVCFESGLLF